MSKNETIGWIGLGNMGIPMARNLMNAGFSLNLYNRTESKTKSFKGKGITIYKDIEELVKNSSIVFTMVANDKAIEDIYNHILPLDNLHGKLFIDMSTISKELSVKTAKSLKEKDASFMDAPVAGSTKPATEGTLLIMAGGESQDIERARPYLEKLGKLIKHLGPNGSGIAAKLTVNYYISMLYQGIAETALLAEKSGVSRADILEIINESASGSGVTRIKTPLLLADNYEPAFALDLMLKDLLLVKEKASEFPLAPVLLNTYQAASKEGYGGQDVVGIINYIKKHQDKR